MRNEEDGREMAAGCDLLLSGGVVLTVDDERRVLDPGWVAIAGERILQVGDEGAGEGPPPARRVIDCRNRVVMPGLVDCHTHLFQGLGRGLGEGMSLWPWLCEFMWPYSSAIDRRDAAVAASLGTIEALRAGTTTILDNHYSPADAESTLEVADAIERAGARGIVARGIFGPMTEVARENGLAETLFRYSREEELEIAEECCHARPPGGRVCVWPAPINVIYNGQDVVRDAVELARRLGTGWHTHCSEARVDPDIYLAAYGVRPITWLQREGLLGEEATIAHGIWLDDQEIKAVGAAAAGVSYNPTSNETLASGVLRLRELQAAGASVGLGTDGSGCAHRQDLFEQMKAGALLQRVHSLDPTAVMAEQMLEMATREGARYLGIDAGVLAPGKLADITVVDLSRPHLSPFHRAVSTVVYAARGSDVVTTIVGGEVVVDDGRCTGIDEEEVMAEAQSRAEALIERAGLAALRLPWRLSGPADLA